MGGRSESVNIPELHAMIGRVERLSVWAAGTKRTEGGGAAS